MVEKKREQDLLAWSAQQLADQGWSCPAELSLQSLNGDAGFRRYFRLVPVTKRNTCSYYT